VAAVPLPGPTRPAIEPLLRAAAMVPTPGPTIPSFEPPSPDAFAPAPTPAPVLMPPPAPPPRAQPPQQAAGIIELKDVEVTFDASPSNRNGRA
jgi:hypothetical protein